MKRQANEVKCIIWDLDNTLWDGVLLEDTSVTLKEDIKRLIIKLDSLGIINSIASKNDRESAMIKLSEMQIEDYFLYPQIGWGNKSDAIETIRKKLNIGYESILFVDDDPFEREEVLSIHPEVRCIDVSEYMIILKQYVDESVQPTAEAAKRRQLYQNEIKREELEKTLQLPKTEFLKSLDMQLFIEDAKDEHLQRCEELTMRTHQLNSTGIAYSKHELAEFIQHKDKRVLICELIDRIGSYGIVGLAYITIHDNCYHIKLLITSCRVLSRGIGSVLLSYIMEAAKRDKRIVVADFIDTGKNKNMYIAYKFSGFREVECDNNIQFVNELDTIPPIPDYIKIIER